MITKINVVGVAAALGVFVTPALASAQAAVKQPTLKPLSRVFSSANRAAHGSVIGAERARTPLVVSPRGRVIGTDPSAAVRFELNRDSARGL
jgi:hypothetical protein